MTLSMPLGMTIGLRRTFPMMWGELIGVGLVSIAILSFVDARPRGMSDIDFEDEDEFSVKDFFECLHYEYGRIRFHADYIRGRCMKTSISAEKDGMVKIGTVNRGEVASRWVDKLKGKKLMQVVKDQNGQQ